jgi:hypothetical protein
LAVGCLYIAAKCKEEDDTIPITPEFVIDCNASCSANELLRMERLILEKFDWFADFVTSVDFLQIVRKNKFCFFVMIYFNRNISFSFSILHFYCINSVVNVKEKEMKELLSKNILIWN